VQTETCSVEAGDMSRWAHYQVSLSVLHASPRVLQGHANLCVALALVGVSVLAPLCVHY